MLTRRESGGGGGGGGNVQDDEVSEKDGERHNRMLWDLEGFRLRVFFLWPGRRKTKKWSNVYIKTHGDKRLIQRWMKWEHNGMRE